MSARLLRNSILGSLSGLCPLIASFVSGVIVARTLGVDAVGTIAFSIWMVLTAVTIADLGIPISLARFLPELLVKHQQSEAAALVAGLFRIFLIATFVAATLLTTLTPWVTSSSGITTTTAWMLTVAWFILQAFNYFYFSYLRGNQLFRRTAWIAIVSAILQIGGVATGAWAAQLPGALLGYMAGSIVPAVLCATLWKKADRVPNELVKRVAVNATYLWLYNILAIFVWARIELFFLSLFFNSEIVGLFSIGLSLSTLAAQVPAFFALSLLPFFTEQYATRQFHALRANYETAMRVMAFIALPIALGLAAIAGVIVPLIYGSAFAAAVPPATILLASAAVPALSTVGSAVIYGMGRNRFFLISISAAAAIMIVTGFTVIPWFGLIGAALARMATQIFLVMLFIWYMDRRLNCPTPLKHLALIMLSASLCAAVAFALVHLIESPYSLVVAIPMAAFVYLACIRALGALPRDDTEKLKKAFGGLPTPIGPSAVFVLDLLARNPPAKNRPK